MLTAFDQRETDDLPDSGDLFGAVAGDLSVQDLSQGLMSLCALLVADLASTKRMTKDEILQGLSIRLAGLQGEE